MADIVDETLMGIVPRSVVREGTVVKPTKMEANAIMRAQAGAMFAADALGLPEQDQIAKAAEVGQVVAASDVALKSHFDSLTPETGLTGLAENAKAFEQAQQEQYDFAAGVTSLDQVGAAFAEMTAIPALLRAIERPEFEPDPNFDYLAIRDKVEAGLREEDRQFLREATSQEELDWKLKEIQGKQERLKELGAHGTGMAVASGLVGGIADPVGWAMGLGVGKVAQLGGIGARTAYMQGQTAKAVGYAAAEGTVGNVLYEATLDAAGNHVTSADYAFAAAFGAAFGQLNLIGAKPGSIDAAIKQQADEIMEAATRQNHELYSTAQTRLGEGATPEQIKAEVDNIQRERYDDVMRIAFADVPESDMILPRYDPFQGESLPSSLADPAVRDELAARWGMGADQIEDAAERTILSEIAYRAERFAAANPVDEARLDTILAKAPWLASTGINLARSQNPVARYVASTLLESTTGATGRRRTAAITKALRERTYMEHLHGYEEAYKTFRTRAGGSMYKDVIGGETRHQFDRLVAQHRENRRLGIQDDADPAVRLAADHLDEGYNRMRLDQQKVGTVGAERLHDNSIGYAPRSLSAKWIKGATNEQLSALSGVLARQLEQLWGDAAFAQRIASRYVDRGRQSADGMTSMPANLHSAEAGEILRDVLADPKLQLTPEQIEKFMGKFSRGGAGHTKARLDLDLSERVTLPTGEEFRVMDAFELDQATLYQRYARRVSGDVALTQFGVMGDQGMRMLRRAMSFGENGKRATPEELEAFDQIYAEFFGRPMAGTGNKHLDNLRMLTSSSRLGGMVFPQIAEMANSVGLLGVKGALKYVGQLPRLIDDVVKGKSNPLLDSIELIGGPIGQDRKVIFPYQEANDTRVYGRDSLGAFDRIVRGGSNALPWLNGWHYLHAAQVRGISEQIVHKAFKYIRTGEDSIALKGMGINDEVAEALRKDLPNIAQFDEKGNLIALDLTKASDAAAANALVQGIHRGSKQIIQGTFIGETGKWAHKDLLRILTQFRTFSITSMEKQWTRQRVDYGTAKATGLLFGAMGFALPIHIARVNIAAMGREDREEYLETQLAPGMLARATLNYASLSGGLGDILDAGAAVAGYEMTGVRGGGRSLTDNIPAAGYINTAGRAITQQDPKDLIRSLPGGNLPWLVPVVNAAAE